MKSFVTALILLLLTAAGTIKDTGIDRKALVLRHTITIKKADNLSSLSLGNGGFAFTADITGLQTFPQYYEQGVPLGTESYWGWHRFPNPENYKPEEALKEYSPEGRPVKYSVQWKSPERNRKASDYFRINPHRLQLGNIGLNIFKKNGQPAAIEDIRDIEQTLTMWTGELRSRFTVEQVPVEVVTYVHQQQDLVAVRVNSPLIKEKRLQIRVRFPYPTGDFKDAGASYLNPEKHISVIEDKSQHGAVISHTLDTTRYFLMMHWSGEAAVHKEQPHDYFIVPADNGTMFEASFRFSPEKIRKRCRLSKRR